MRTTTTVNNANAYRALPESNHVPQVMIQIDNTERQILELQQSLGPLLKTRDEMLRKEWPDEEIECAGFILDAQANAAKARLKELGYRSHSREPEGTPE